MLFIPDLHIWWKYKHTILDKLSNILEKTQEKNIIFLGDYVYHFAYDRGAISRFFDIVLSAINNWKNVYLIAWNHDWIANHFIFEEAEKITNLNSNKKLHIMSKPTIQKIENKNVLFMPFFFDSPDKNIIRYIEDKVYSNTVLSKMLFEAKQLLGSWKKNKILSWVANLHLIKALVDNPQIDVLVHHFYIADTIFPAQKTKFTYSDIALSKFVLQLPLNIVSWHLHTPFIYENYVCVGSFYHTSILEADTIKCICYFKNDNFYFEPVILNPYINIDYIQQSITEETVREKLKIIIKNTEKNINQLLEKCEIDLQYVNIVVLTQQLFDIKAIIHSSLKDKIWSVQIRKKYDKNVENILNKLKIDKQVLQTSFGSWKQLAKEHIKAKYPNNYKEYLDILEEIWL